MENVCVMAMDWSGIQENYIHSGSLPRLVNGETSEANQSNTTFPFEEFFFFLYVYFVCGHWCITALHGTYTEGWGLPVESMVLRTRGWTQEVRLSSRCLYWLNHEMPKRGGDASFHTFHTSSGRRTAFPRKLGRTCHFKLVSSYLHYCRRRCGFHLVELRKWNGKEYCLLDVRS